MAYYNWSGRHIQCLQTFVWSHTNTKAHSHVQFNSSNLTPGWSTRQKDSHLVSKAWIIKRYTTKSGPFLHFLLKHIWFSKLRVILSRHFVFTFIFILLFSNMKIFCAVRGTEAGLSFLCQFVFSHAISLSWQPCHFQARDQAWLRANQLSVDLTCFTYITFYVSYSPVNEWIHKRIHYLFN